jgi:pSer/pThr/pTyr-binding forkhead associated (FHA) protein
MQNGMIDLGDYGKSDWTIMLNDRVIARFTLNEGKKAVIGRSPDADVVIDNTAISRHHSSLELRDGRHYLADLKSTNGTTVNGKKITSKTPITENDVVFLGKFHLTQSVTAPNQTGSLSFISPMELDEETVFVASRKQQMPPGPNALFSPPVNEVFRLTVLEGTAQPKKLSLDGRSSIKIGKDPSCDMVLSGWLVGKTQCYVICKQDRYYIVPQNSWTSTRLNDFAIKEERPLRKGDVIQIKSTRIRFD